MIAIEFAFYRSRRMRKEDEARDNKYPAYRRYDAKNWSRWQFYPGALLTMPTRILLLFIIIFNIIFWIFILSFGHDYSKGPMKKGCRKSCIKFFYICTTTFYAFLTGMFSSKKSIDFDYSYYLGPNYKE